MSIVHSVLEHLSAQDNNAPAHCFGPIQNIQTYMYIVQFLRGWIVPAPQILQVKSSQAAFNMIVASALSYNTADQQSEINNSHTTNIKAIIIIII